MATKINGVVIQILKPGLIQIESFNKKRKFYTVDLREKICSCPDFTYRGRKCKHLKFAEEHENTICLETEIWKSNRKFEEWWKKQAPAFEALKIMNSQILKYW
ncbi:MAG: SWIM zinc finger family protein [Candidatus Bathyarchaeia archaeon]